MAEFASYLASYFRGGSEDNFHRDTIDGPHVFVSLCQLSNSTVDHNNYFGDAYIEDQTGQYDLNWASVLMYDIEYCTWVKKRSDNCIRGNCIPLETTADRFIMEIHSKPCVGDYSRRCARPFVTDGNLVITKDNKCKSLDLI